MYPIRKNSILWTNSLNLRQESENPLGKHNKTLRFDQGGGLVSNRLDSFLRAQGILSQLSTPMTPLQNREKEKKKLNFDGHSKINDEFLITSHIFWGYALETMFYLLYVKGISICKISKKISRVITFIVKIIKKYLLT